MPWICKVKSPFGEKGHKVKPVNTIFAMKLDFGNAANYSFEDYPDLFEFVEEKSDEEIINNWILRIVPFGSERITSMEYLAKCLLLENAIKPEFLEKLRRGE